MSAREVIVLALKPFSHLPERDASYVIGTLKENGFTIMSKEDVEAMRDKALEEAAKIFDGGLGGSVNRRNVAVTIRKLKSGPTRVPFVAKFKVKE